MEKTEGLVEFEILPDISSICRTCMEAEKKYYQISDYVDECHIIMEMLDEIVPQLQIKNDECEFPPLICESCVEKLIICYKFHNLCLESNNQLRQLILSNEHNLNVDEYKESKTTIEDCDVDEERLLERNEYRDFTAIIDKEEKDTKQSQCPLNPELTCSDCGKNFDQLSNQKSHCCMFAEIYFFKCDMCKQSFDNENIYKSHLEGHKTNEASIELLDNIDDQIKENISEVIDSQVVEENEDFNDLYGFEIENLNEEEWNNDREILDGKDTYINAKDSFTENKISTEDSKIEELYIGEIEKTDKKNLRSGSYPCDVCGKVFDRISRYNRHSRVHALHKPYACDICKRRFSTIHYLKTHQLLHTKKDVDESSQNSVEGFKCPDCPRRFENKNALSGHRRMHTDKSKLPNFLCNICQRKFLSSKTLVDHIRNQHPDAEKYACHKCDKKFVLEEQLLEHTTKHRDKELVCTVCHKEFAFECFLKEHMRVHSGESPFLCPECGKTFKTGGNLRQHLERHSTTKKYQCPHCTMRFKCRSNVNKHLATHKGLKTHQCNICGSRFTRAYNLVQHKRLHFEGKSHKCELCDISFDSAFHLRRHLHTHNDDLM